MRSLNIEYKDISESKITITPEEIRIKIKSTLPKDIQEKHSNALLLCVEYFNTKEYPITMRYNLVLNIENDTFSLKLKQKLNEALGITNWYISYEEIKGNK